MKKRCWTVGGMVLGALCAMQVQAMEPVDYAKKMTLTVNPAAVGFVETTVPNVAVAVRLSETIPGFSYADVQSFEANKDLLFTDGQGSRLDYEIESWNDAGESVVWVKIPRFASGERFYLYYGGEAVPQNAAGVWGAYGGVWHMAEADGTVADASGNGRNAVPGGEAEAMAQSIATTGPVGNGRVNCTSGTAYLAAENSTQLGFGDTFTVSGWFLAYEGDQDGEATLITTKERRWDGEGWGIRLQKGKTNEVIYRGRGDAGWATLCGENVPDLTAGWVHLAVAYGPGDGGQLYVNGKKFRVVRNDQKTETTWLQSATDSTKPLTFGYNSNNVWDDGWSRRFHGAFDEIRISDGTMSAAQVQAEYGAQLPDALTYVVTDNKSGFATVALKNFSKTFTVAASADERGYQGDAAYGDFPMLVRLSAAIEGFSYDDFIQSDFSDLAFFDAEGKALAFDVDTWNTAGESLVWVKVPSFTKSTAVTVAYGGLVKNDLHQPATWSAYRGVWHMNDAGDGEQTVADATANRMDGVSHARTEAVADGALGGGRLMARNRGASDQNGGVRVPFKPAMNIEKDRFHLIASSWIKFTTGGNWGAVFFSRKNDMADGGWGMAVHNTEMNHYDFYFRESYEGIYTPWSNGAGGYTQYQGSESIWNATSDTAEWHKLTFDYYWDGSICYANVYLDGNKGSACWLFNKKADAEGNEIDERSYAPIYQPTDRGMSFGGFIGGGTHPLLGAMDEIRFRTGEIDQDREGLEYAQEKNAGYYVYSAVADVPDSTVPGLVNLGAEIEGTVTGVGNKNVLAVTGTVASVSGSSATVKLMVGVAEQKDGEAWTNLVCVATKVVTEAGPVELSWDGAVLGTKIGYALQSDSQLDATHEWTSSSVMKSQILTDSAEYKWRANASGRWSDAANWERTSADDGLPRLGYPSYGSRWAIYGNQTDVIEVDAAYDVSNNGITLGWGGADITFKGVVPGASIDMRNAGFKDGQYSNVKVTLDAFSFKNVGSYHIYKDSSLTLRNGASVYTRWETVVEGDNATLVVGDGCSFYQDGVDGDRFVFAGENASITIDNGTLRTRIFKVGGNGSDATGYVGKKLNGLVFKGAAPQLQIYQYAKLYTDPGADIPVTFTIPEEGFGRTPIVKVGPENRKLFEIQDGVAHGFAFAIDKDSPFFGVFKGRLNQTIADWSFGGTKYAINDAGIALARPIHADSKVSPAGWFYSDAKDTLSVALRNTAGFSIIFR